MRGQVRVEHLDAPRRSPARTAAAMATAVAGSVGHGHGSSPRIGGHPEPAVLDRRGLGQHLVAVERTGRRIVGAQHVDAAGSGCGGGRHVGEVEGLDVGGVVEHGRRAAR